MNSHDYIVVGLGNPGKEYENTRHNSGFRAVDFMSKKFGVNFDKSKFKSLVGQGTICSKTVLFLKPQTYMNLSGQAVLEAMNFYKVPSERTILIFDDISLPVGKIRIRKSGSHGGQNGVRNIISLSGTDTFPRIKIGVGEKPNPHWDLSDWVLSKFSKEEVSEVDGCLNSVCKAVEMIVDGKIDYAMNEFN